MSDMNHIPYIYKIKCIPTGKYYIGSRTMKGRNSSEFWTKGGYFTSSATVKSLREEHGDDVWEIEILKEFTEWANIKDVVADEHAFIRQFMHTEGKESLINQFWYSEGSKVFSVAGRVKTVEEKAHLSKINTGKVVPDDVRKRISASHQGSKLPDEVKAKIGDAHRGKVVSDETRAKQSAAAKLRPPKTPEARQHHSNVTKGIPKPVVSCPHCNKSGGKGVMGRWHFDNCKENKS